MILKSSKWPGKCHYSAKLTKSRGQQLSKLTISIYRNSVERRNYNILLSISLYDHILNDLSFIEMETVAQKASFKRSWSNGRNWLFNQYLLLPCIGIHTGILNTEVLSVFSVRYSQKTFKNGKSFLKSESKVGSSIFSAIYLWT